MHNTLRSVKLNVLCALVFNRPNDLLFQGYIRKYDTEAAFVGLQVFWHLKVSGLTGMLSRCTSGSCGSHILPHPGASRRKTSSTRRACGLKRLELHGFGLRVQG